jgi:eukaryotic-like serine/threonine-protein kinase
MNKVSAGDDTLVLGRYRVLGHLARGGMAELFLGKLTGPGGFERPVAIKRILPELLEDASFTQMLLDEARLAARIRHPNVVQVQELGSQGTEVILVMEYLDGENAAGLMRRLVAKEQRLPFALAAHIVSEACSGLGAAHALTDAEGHPLHVVHRDISPENLFVTYDGQVKVLDFGIAKAKDRLVRTEVGQTKGKYQYMSPEQLTGQEVDARADIFALGIVLYELTVGRRLFREESIVAVCRAICEDPIPLPSAICPGYPAALEKVVMHALERAPADRFQSANEMRRELNAAMATFASVDARDELRHLMERVFEDRMAQKRELLASVDAGRAPVGFPEANADTHVQVPEVDRTQTSAVTRSMRPGKGGTRMLPFALVALGVFALATVVVVVSPWRSDAPVPTPEPAKAPELPVSQVAVPVPEMPVQIEIATVPSEARVLIGGKPRGVTPLVLELPKSSESIAVEIAKPGFKKIERSIVPSVNQRLEILLSPSRDKRPAPTPPKSKTEEPKYRRFQ